MLTLPAPTVGRSFVAACLAGAFALTTALLPVRADDALPPNHPAATSIVVAVPEVSLPGLTAAGEAQVLSPRTLRGFGQVAGRFQGYTGADGPMSALTVGCENETLALRLAGKFLADQEAFGDTGVVPAAARPIVRVKGTLVTMLAAATPADLATLDKALGWPAVDPAAAEAALPMYLEGWDRHGWRFYYRPWELPEEVEWKDYRVLDEFRFADELGDLGFVFWAESSVSDTAEGLSNDRWWNWAARAAERRNLPFVVNTMSSASTAMLNRFRDQGQMKMPQYTGSSHSVAEPGHAGHRQLSWASTTAKDAQLANLQAIVRRWTDVPQVVDWLEPHGELNHGDYDLFVEYGPASDANMQRYMKARYGDLAAVSQRWYGRPDALASWDAVRVPELASFAGWGPEAMDLQGTWRVSYEAATEVPAKEEPNDLMGLELVLDAPDPDAPPKAAATHPALADTYADADWGTILAPGNDEQMFLTKRAAIFRRTFVLPADWKAKHPRTWLYVWDLNRAWDEPVMVGLNGALVANDPVQHPNSHWTVKEVTKVLREGSNSLALHLPEAYLGYRIYLTGEEPKQYPNLSPELNAQWVDFTDWRQQARLGMARRGMEMIRQVDPNRGIVSMAPDGFLAGVKELCVEYGARFHNTGHMGGFWNDYLPMVMRGADLPFSVEPGGPATDVLGFKTQMGLYFTEGIQAVHYFIHVGNVLWPREIREHFTKIQPLVQTIGQSHPPKAEVAMLLSDRVDSLTGFPWNFNYNMNLPSGYWGVRMSDGLGREFPIDAVTDRDFATTAAGTPGDAAPYRVIVDTNTAIMDAALVDEIGDWVRAGGVFVTIGQTGRHTPEQANAWPISRLTGYTVSGVDPFKEDGGEANTRQFRIAPDQPIFNPADWPAKEKRYSNGLSLVRDPAAPECVDLAYWADGTVAAGLRPLGKGYVVNLGMRFSNGKHTGGRKLQQLVTNVLDWAKARRLPAVATASEPDISLRYRHYVSNNGLYDVWTLFNENRDVTNSITLTFRDAPPARFSEVGSDGTLLDPTAPIALEPLQTRIFVSPRPQQQDAALAWFQLQRNWWRGTTPPPAKPLPAPRQDELLDLSDDWAYRVLDVAETAAAEAAALAAAPPVPYYGPQGPAIAKPVKAPTADADGILQDDGVPGLDLGTDADQAPTSGSAANAAPGLPLLDLEAPAPAAPASISPAAVAALAAPDLDTSDWPRRPLNCWAVPDELPGRHVLFRRRFTVPASWGPGSVSLWMRAFFSYTVAGSARYWLDGKPVGNGGDGRYGIILDPVDLAPGTEHLLAIEIRGKGQVVGVRGNTWLAHIPAPAATLDLAGDWLGAPDFLKAGTPQALPGQISGSVCLWRDVDVPADWAGSQVYLHADSTQGFTGVIINGAYLRRHHHNLGEATHLNLTPWLRPGESNKIELVGGGGKGPLGSVALWRYPADTPPPE